MANDGVRVSRISSPGTAISGGQVVDNDPNAELRGQRWFGSYGTIGIARKMLRDPHVRQSVNYLTDPLRCATWRFKPASKSAIHVEQADFLTWCFTERLRWDQIIKLIVTGYAVDGFSLSEMLDDVEQLPAGRFTLHPGGGTGVVPVGVYDIPANTVNAWHAKPGRPDQLESVDQWVPFADGVASGLRSIPADRLLRFSYDQEGANFAGLSVLRSAFGAWKCKNAFLAISAVKHERRGVGTPILILGEEASDEDVDAAQSALEQMRSNAKGFAVFPNGYEFKWEGGSQSDETNIDAAIEMCNRDIAYNVGASFMLLGSGGQSGSWALSSTQQSQYHLAMVGHAKFVGLGFTHGFDGWSPARRILELNYGAIDALPTLEARNLPTRNWLDVLPVAINAANVGLITPDAQLEDEIREVLQFRPHDPTTARARGSAQVSLNPPAPVKSPVEDDQDIDDEGEDL